MSSARIQTHNLSPMSPLHHLLVILKYPKECAFLSLLFHNLFYTSDSKDLPSTKSINHLGFLECLETLLTATDEWKMWHKNKALLVIIWRDSCFEGFGFEPSTVH